MDIARCRTWTGRGPPGGTWLASGAKSLAAAKTKALRRQRRQLGLQPGRQRRGRVSRSA